MAYPKRSYRSQALRLTGGHVISIKPRGVGAGHYMKGIVGQNAKLYPENLQTRKMLDEPYRQRMEARRKDRHTQRAFHARSPRAKRHYRRWEKARG